MENKKCLYCSGDFPLDAIHWQIRKGGIIECKKQKKDARQKAQKKKNVEKYGTENPRDSAEFHMDINKKRTQTMIEKYGSANAMNIPILNTKQKKTLLKNYGVEHPAQNKDVVEKTKRTSLERYGLETNLKLPENVKLCSDSKKEKFSILLSDGTRLRDFCDNNKVSRAWAYKMFKYNGETFLREYIRTYEQKINSLELQLIDILGNTGLTVTFFNKFPSAEIPYRPDFLIEKDNKRLYVNVDGLYWHSEIHQENKEYHREMRQVFEKSDERLMQFRSNELLEKRDIIKSMICNFFGINNRIYARECEIRKIDKEVANAFCQKSHLMGEHPSCKSYGLLKENCVVAIMGVRNKEDELHIERFCNKLGTSVVGGFQKLLNYSQLAEGAEKIVSFCDLRYSTGLSYDKSGFVKVAEHLGWAWTNGASSFNRLYCRANMDERRLSEAEHAAEMKLFKIYDAGQAKYTKEIKNAK